MCKAKFGLQLVVFPISGCIQGIMGRISLATAEGFLRRRGKKEGQTSKGGVKLSMAINASQNSLAVFKEGYKKIKGAR